MKRKKIIVPYLTVTEGHVCDLLHLPVNPILLVAAAVAFCTFWKQECLAHMSYDHMISYDIIWSCMIIKLIIIACFNRASSPSSSSSYDDNCFTGAGCCGTGVRRRWKVRNVVVAPLVINVTCEQWTIEHCTCKHITYYTMNVVVIMNMVSFCAWAEYQL